ncbi:MAG: hypothetical protein OZ917_05775 [Candidatus Brocadiaceae bacterium]|nr:hypothetical protein [Candidatus Brocadiaceae bacterium]
MEGKKEEKGEVKNNENERGEGMSGFFIDKRSLWLMAGGALGALAVIGIGRLSKKMRPAAVGVTKEGIAFKEWLITNYEKVKEDIEDIVAEAKHVHLKDLEAEAETEKKEQDLLKKVEQMVEMALRQRSKKEEA